MDPFSVWLRVATRWLISLTRCLCHQRSDAALYKYSPLRPLQHPWCFPWCPSGAASLWISSLRRRRSSFALPSQKRKCTKNKCWMIQPFCRRESLLIFSGFFYQERRIILYGVSRRKSLTAMQNQTKKFFQNSKRSPLNCHERIFSTGLSGEQKQKLDCKLQVLSDTARELL